MSKRSRIQRRRFNQAEESYNPEWYGEELKSVSDEIDGLIIRWKKGGRKTDLLYILKLYCVKSYAKGSNKAMHDSFYSNLNATKCSEIFSNSFSAMKELESIIKKEL